MPRRGGSQGVWCTPGHKAGSTARKARRSNRKGGKRKSR